MAVSREWSSNGLTFHDRQIHGAWQVSKAYRARRTHGATVSADDFYIEGIGWDQPRRERGHVTDPDSPNQQTAGWNKQT